MGEGGSASDRSGQVKANVNDKNSIGMPRLPPPQQQESKDEDEKRNPGKLNGRSKPCHFKVRVTQDS
jgi:hypothetical protein